jgi:pyruvate/2-oxoglutarate dehydrogenase complex dihydrolipoamide dehydrogenase (E3) component
MIGIVDWRIQQCEKFNIVFHFNTYAEAEDVTALDPDVVIIATGGWPDTQVLETGNDLVVSSWDIISGHELPGKNVLIFDDAGDHPGLQAAEVIANTGAKVEIMTPDRSFAPEVMAMNLVPYMRSLQDKDVTFTVTHRLKDVERDGNQLKAIIGTDYSDFRKTANYDQVVINHGTLPLDELYFELKPLSNNKGAVNYQALIAGNRQELQIDSKNTFQLFRIGDAVSARNTHAAIYDALRLVKDI